MTSKANESNKISYDSLAYKLYRQLLSLLLGNRLIFIAIMIGLLFSATNIFQYVKERSLGPSERNQFTVYIDLPAGMHINETIQATRTLSDYLLDSVSNPEVTDVLAYVGAGGPRFFLALSPNDPQPNKSFLVVNTQTSEQINTVMRRVEDFIKKDHWAWF